MYDTATSDGKNVATTQNTTWPGPARNDFLDSEAQQWGGGTNCPPQTVALQAKAAAQLAADNNWDTLTVLLAATTTAENGLGQWSWKRFDASSIKMVFFWGNKPDAPAGPGTQNVFNAATGTPVTGCSQNSSSPDWVNTLTPTWTATINDRDSYTQ